MVRFNRINFSCWDGFRNRLRKNYDPEGYVCVCVGCVGVDLAGRGEGDC